MNYLAHAYLSFRNPQWVTGNLISDFVKGKKKFDYPAAVQQGIELHRAIDNFTDAHSLHKQARAVFRPFYRLYAGAFVDVVFDHFLANDTVHFADEAALDSFTAFTYQSMQASYPILPLEFQQVFERMRKHNWLFNYRFRFGMERSFAGLVYRSKYLTESETAFNLFELNYSALRESYRGFFPELFEFAENYSRQLII